jgi:hypothetical protein
VCIANLYMMYSQLVVAANVLFPALSAAQQLLRDPGIAGPPLEIVHLYNDQWPTGTFHLPSFALRIR